MPVIETRFAGYLHAGEQKKFTQSPNQLQINSAYVTMASTAARAPIHPRSGKCSAALEARYNKTESTISVECPRIYHSSSCNVVAADESSLSSEGACRRVSQSLAYTTCALTLIPIRTRRGGADGDVHSSDRQRPVCVA